MAREPRQRKAKAAHGHGTSRRRKDRPGADAAVEAVKPVHDRHGTEHAAEMDPVDSATGRVNTIREPRPASPPDHESSGPKHREPINGSDADHLAQLEATITFPKVEIAASRRPSGIDEAQAFFEFSRRYAASVQPLEGHAPVIDGDTEPEDESEPSASH